VAETTLLVKATALSSLLLQLTAKLCMVASILRTPLLRETMISVFLRFRGRKR